MWHSDYGCVNSLELDSLSLDWGTDWNWATAFELLQLLEEILLLDLLLLQFLLLLLLDVFQLVLQALGEYLLVEQLLVNRSHCGRLYYWLLLFLLQDKLLDLEQLFGRQ